MATTVLLYKKYLLAILFFSMALWIISTGASCATPENSYIGNISEALDALKSGQTRESLQSLKKALAYNAGDPIAHVALGLTLLSGGRADDAMNEFKIALELDKCAEAYYGQGLAYLNKCDYSSAISSFKQAQTAKPGPDIQAAIYYAEMMSGVSNAQMNTDSQNESMQALSAFKLMNERQYSEAISVWKKLQPGTVRPTFGERIGCSMTFLKNSPVALTGWPISEPYNAPSPTNSKLKAVSGTITLKADLSNARSVAMVSFFVDDVFVGITNHQPFEYKWDTTKSANGLHKIQIKGNDNSGFVITEKSTEVMVHNEGKMTPLLVTGSAADKAWEALWQLLVLKPSAVAINYNLAVCAIDSKDNDTAIAALERVLAIDPDYRDAAEQLSALYSPNEGEARLFKCDTNKKVIALTFDDGPRANTPELLDLLKQKDVKATFFVVGKQAETYESTLQRMSDDGHELQNHTYNHRDLEYLSDREIMLELFKASAVVRSLTGKALRFIRPPGGHEGARLPAIAQTFGITTVFWTINCYKYEGTTKEKMHNYVVSSAKPGAIILMHNAEAISLRALPNIIDDLKKKGYSFVTISELVKQGN